MTTKQNYLNLVNENPEKNGSDYNSRLDKWHIAFYPWIFGDDEPFTSSVS
jgi:hypothetical protein